MYYRHNANKVAKLFGVTNANVLQVLSKLGFERRGRGGPNNIKSHEQS